MNIAKIIEDQLNKDLRDKQALISKFINNPERDDAVEIAKIICTANEKKNIIGDFLAQLVKFESEKSDRRDHVIHTVNTYLLGMHIIDYLVLDFNPDDIFTWKIASVFHDIGYQRAIDYQRAINSPIDFPINSSFKNICQDHGFWGAQMTWDKIYAEYSIRNPDKKDIIDLTENKVDYSWKNLEVNILPACEAILLHNEPQNYLPYKKVNYCDDKKCAFLLILCDTVQSWSRPMNGEFDYKNNYKSEGYDIECSTCTNNDFYEISFGFPNSEKANQARKELEEKCNLEFVDNTPKKKLIVRWLAER